VATLTYVYAESTVVVGPLATYQEPHLYDLCEKHSLRMVPPRGWELVMLDANPVLVMSAEDELNEMAASVRQAAGVAPAGTDAQDLARKGHLRVVRETEI